MARQARHRASDAGATAEQLQAGDLYSQAAEKAIQGRLPASAVAHLDQAAAAWSDAERAVRGSRAAAAVPAALQPEATKEPRKATAVAMPPPAQPTAPPASNATSEIATLVADYAKALDARDVAALRRVYPEMTPSQLRSFEDFFRSARTLHATFSMSNLQVEGASAEARLVGAYDFVTSTGQSEHQPLTLNAVFRKDANGWRIASIR